MDRLGRYALLLALALAVWGLLAAVVGLRRQRPLAVESARTTAFALLAVVAAANGAMLAALLSDDFTLRYVAQNSSRATPTFFKVLALWSADDGSLLRCSTCSLFRARRSPSPPWRPRPTVAGRRRCCRTTR